VQDSFRDPSGIWDGARAGDWHFEFFDLWASSIACNQFRRTGQPWNKPGHDNVEKKIGKLRVGNGRIGVLPN